MVKSLRRMTLSTAIGIALVGAGMQISSVEAATAQASAPQQMGQARVDGVYIITFDEAGLLYYSGSVNGIQATMPSANGKQKLDRNSAAAVAYQNYLVTQRSGHVSDIEFALGRNLAVTHNYAITQNGIAAQLTATEADQVAAMPGVKSLRPAGVEYIDTYRGPKFIGADTIWDGTNTPSLTGQDGRGILVGILDSGANSSHPSFANDAFCGYRASFPKLKAAVDCSVTDSLGFCAGPEPEAIDGHGVHTASTTAGNTIDNTASPAPLLPDGVTMSGVAPCAQVISYRVCPENTCPGADLQAGLENAIADGVDVINYSISGGRDPWNDLDRVFLDAVNADVFVAASAGNTSTTVTSVVGTVNHLGPWTLTVAASTMDQLIGPQLSVTGPSPLPPPPPDLAHIPLNPGTTTLVSDTMNFVSGSVVSYPTNITGCTTTGAFPGGYFANRIALIQRGGCSFTEKITNGFNAGAYMVVIANNQVGSLNMDTAGAPAIPAFSITQDFGDALLAYVAPNNPPAPPADQIFSDGFENPIGGTTADYGRAIQSSRQGDVIANFSLRGPSPALVADETKPDITGPGVDIYAAVTADEGNYGFLSGTSMSSPHLAGSAALVRAVHPDWSVTEVKSALMMTATNANGVREDGVTPWTFDDVGSGRVDLTKAALAALTMDETFANFVAADPALAGDVKTLNLPALRDMNCDPTCSWTRTVRNRSTGSTSWEVTSATDPSFAIVASPATFSLAPGATQAITFTVTPNATMSTIKFGTVTLAQPAAGINGIAPMLPAQHISVSVKSPAPPPVPGVCDGGVCDLKIDGLPAAGGSFNNLGCGATSPCQLIWLNQFAADPAEFPITLNSVQTIFSSTSTVVGDLFDVFIYQDTDGDPSNGATLVTSILNQPIGAQDTLVTIPISGGAVMNGPGDILVAFVNRTINPFPAAADDGVAFANKSWVALGTMSTSPDLSAIGLTLTTTALPSFTHNWVVRAQGTNAGGAPVSLSPSAK